MPRTNRWVAEPRRPARRPSLVPLPSSVSEAISQLQASWSTLHFIDRAYALEDLRKAQLSGHILADFLNCSESLLRWYQTALQASPADIDLARAGQISLRELVRRATGRDQQNAPNSAEPNQPALAIPPAQGAAIIIEWLCADPARQASARAIVQEALRILDVAERSSKLPTVRIPAAFPVQQLIDRCRPDRHAFEFDVPWYAHWLAMYAIRLIPNAADCRDAFNEVLTHFPAPARKSRL